MRQTDKFRRSAGTIWPQDLVRNRFRSPAKTAIEADIAAMERGEGRTAFCSFRGLYGEYPRRFRGCWLDMKDDTLVLRPLLIVQRIRGKRIVITEQVLEAHARAFDSAPEALKMGSTGLFGPGEPLAFAGSVVISCRTARGILEFAVRRPDVELVLHFFARLASKGSNAGRGEL